MGNSGSTVRRRAEVPSLLLRSTRKLRPWLGNKATPARTRNAGRNQGQSPHPSRLYSLRGKWRGQLQRWRSLFTIQNISGKRISITEASNRFCLPCKRSVANKWLSRENRGMISLHSGTPLRRTTWSHIFCPL